MQNSNQFAQQPDIGDVDLQQGASNVISCIVDVNETSTLSPGMALTQVDTVSGVPVVAKATADDDEIFGFVARNFKRGASVAEDRLEVALKNTIMYMQAGAAIAAGAKVEADVSEDKVVTNAAGTVVGWAFDKAEAADDLIRVYIETPYAA